MKKLLFGLLATIMLGFAGNSQDVTKLGNDKDFISFINNEYNFISKPTDLSTLKKIFEDNILKEEELTLFYKSYSVSESQYLTYTKSQNLLLNNVKEKYKLTNFSNEELGNIFTNAMSSFYLTNLTNRTDPKSCLRKLRNDLSIAAATAGIGHIGCLSLEVTVLGGVLCHAAVGAAHYFAIDNAELNYNECMGR